MTGILNLSGLDEHLDLGYGVRPVLCELGLEPLLLYQFVSCCLAVLLLYVCLKPLLILLLALDQCLYLLFHRCHLCPRGLRRDL